MKLIRWAALIVATISILLSGVGCQEKSTTGGGDNQAEVGSVQIVTGATNDTLWFVPTDSASTTVTVIVTDTRGNAMSGQRVNIGLDNASLGVIEYVDDALRDTTNAQGRVNCVFRTYAQAGDQIITATTSGRTANRVLVIRPLSNSINAVTLIVTPERLEASPLVEDSANVEVTIVDAANRGVPNVSLNLSANGGRLVVPSPTDSSGRTTTKWFNNRQFGEFTIYVRAASLVDSASVMVQEVPPILGTLTVATSDPEIEADGCITAATISATLKNQFGEAVRGDTVRFGAPDLGAVQPWAVTDSLGVATVNFCGMGIPNDQDPADSAMVVARYELWGIRDTVNVRIIPAAGIGDVNLSAANTTGTAGTDSVGLSLNVFFANGARVTGYYAKFRATEGGAFKYDSTRLVDGRPDSANFYYLPQTVPANPPQITVEVDGHFSEPLSINVSPGVARYVGFNFAIAPFNLGGFGLASVTVTDTFHNPVRSGVPVNFTTTIGAIPAFVQTDEAGVADTIIRSANQAGSGIVVAKLVGGLDSSFTSVTINAGDGNQIVTALNPPSMNVRGTGGQDWSQIQASVFDASGNPVQDGTWVYFTLSPGFPQGANINNHGSRDSSQTANGVAVATLNAGSGTGAVNVDACINTTSGQTCSPSTGNIVAGPPFEIQIGVNEIGVHAGGAAWDVEISALIKDNAQNNVIDGTAVFFDVVPFERAQILSEEVVVGNLNADGEDRPGVAFTTLRYTSLVTNQPITITARTANGVSRQLDFILPIQEPTIVLNCLPGSWHFVAQGDTCRIDCQSQVRDGHGVLINGQQVYYTAQRGRMYDNRNGLGTPINTAFTGPDFGFLDGTCSIWLVEQSAFIFPDPLTPEIPGEVRVEVVGYPDATDSQVINFRRGVG